MQRTLKMFPEGIVLFWAAFFLFPSFLCLQSTLSLERLDRTQLNFHTRWRGGLARWFDRLATILEKHCFLALSSLIPSSSSFFKNFIYQNIHPTMKELVLYVKK